MSGTITASLSLRPAFKPLRQVHSDQDALVELGSFSSLAKTAGLSFALETEGAETLKSYVPTRGTSVSACRIGAPSDTDTSLRHVVQNLLAMNSSATVEEQVNSTYLNLAFSRVFKNLSNREMIVLAVRSSQPKFVVFTRGVPIYVFSVLDADGPKLVFTNESGLDMRLRDTDPKCCVYRMPVVSEGVCVVQAYFLEKKFLHWTNVLHDNLKVMSALETHLSKRWLGSNFVDL